MPIIKVQPWIRRPVGRVLDVGAGGSDVAGPRVGAENLKSMREPLVGAQQQPLILLIARGLPHVNRTVRAERQRIVPLFGGGALRNHRATDAVVVVDVKAARAQAPMNEMAEDEVGGE